MPALERFEAMVDKLERSDDSADDRRVFIADFVDLLLEHTLDAVIDAGGYNTGTVCEDMEVIVRLHRKAREKDFPGRVIFVPDPVCWTECPETFRALRHQREAGYR